MTSNPKLYGRLALEPMLMLASNDKNDKTKNNYKMQKMLKKVGNKNKLNEIQKMLAQIRDQKKRDHKLKINNYQNEYLKKDTDDEEEFNIKTRRNSHIIQRFSLKNIKNLTFQGEEIEKNLIEDEYDLKKSTATQAVDLARNFLNIKKPGQFDFKTLITEPEDITNPFKAFIKDCPIFEESSKTNRFESKREENFIMNYSRSQNLKKIIINKKRNETISQRINSQKLPDVYYNEYKYTNNSNKPITEFGNHSISKIEFDQMKESINTVKTEKLLKMKPVQEKKENPIENLKLKNKEISQYMKTLNEDKFKKTMEVFKLSLSNEDDFEKPSGFKNNMKFGYVGYLLKSDYFAKQEKKEYLQNTNQYPNKKFYFFRPNNSRKQSLPQNSSNGKKRLSNFNDYLYEMDPSSSPNTLGKNIKEFSNFLKISQDIEKQRKLIDYVGQFVRKEEKAFYNNNLNMKNENLSIRKEHQKNFFQSKALKQEIFDFYHNLIDYQEKEADIQELKTDIINSFKEYDEDFQNFILNLIKYSDHLRKIENDKKLYENDGFSIVND